MTVRLVWGCPRPVWAALVAQSPVATIADTPEWAAATAAAGLGATTALLASWPGGRQALLLVRPQRRWPVLLGQAQLGGYGGYAGLLTTQALSPQEQDTVWRAVAQRFPGCYGAGFAESFPPVGAGFRRIGAHTTRLLEVGADLPAAESVTPAARALATRVMPQAGFVEQDRFWHWSRQGCSLWGLDGAPSRRWFEALWRFVGGRLRLVLASLAGEPAGALLWAGNGQQARFLGMAWSQQVEDQAIETALVAAALADARTLGCRVWDVGSAVASESVFGRFAGIDRPVWTFAQAGRSGRVGPRVEA